MTSDTIQRRVQMRTDDPPQYFFSFNMNKTEDQPYVSSLSKDLKDSGITELVKLETMPLDQNKILVRLTNLAES
jgi:hypothetical protein